MSKSLAMEHLSEGYRWYGKGFYEEAIEEFTKSLDYDDTIADAYYNRGLAYEALGDTQSALVDLEQAVAYSKHDDLTEEISGHIENLNRQSIND